jgi:hypothetical protein
MQLCTVQAHGKSHVCGKVKKREIVSQDERKKKKNPISYVLASTYVIAAVKS